TLLLWWRTSRAPSGAGLPTVPGAPARPSGRAALRRIRDACARHDAPAARTALLGWAAERFRDDPPRALGPLAARLPERAAAAVRELEAALYAPGGRRWDGAALAGALEERAVTAPRPGGGPADPLMPLYR